METNNVFPLYCLRTYVAVNYVIHIEIVAMEAEACHLCIAALYMSQPTA
jgi:hypothetical protein